VAGIGPRGLERERWFGPRQVKAQFRESPSISLRPVALAWQHCVASGVSLTDGNRLPVKPDRSGSGLGWYQTSSNLKFKFKFKKMRNS